VAVVGCYFPSSSRELVKVCRAVLVRTYLRNGTPNEAKSGAGAVISLSAFDFRPRLSTDSFLSHGGP